MYPEQQFLIRMLRQCKGEFRRKKCIHWLPTSSCARSFSTSEMPDAQFMPVETAKVFTRYLSQGNPL